MRHRIGVAAFALLMGCCVGRGGLAADRFFLFNLTNATSFTGVYLAPVGTSDWGPNQALNDKDRAVDSGERLALKGIGRGRFDVRLESAKGLVCLKRNVDLVSDTSFDFREAELAGCK
jgi:hypothetical protein